MKGHYKAVSALLLALVVLLLLLLLTLTYGLPMLAGVILPAGSTIALTERPQLSRSGLHIADLRYQLAGCEFARIANARLTHPGRWQLHIDQLTINSTCLSQLADKKTPESVPRTLAQWQAMLPESRVIIDTLRITPWDAWQGQLTLSLSPQQQEIHYHGNAMTLAAQLRGQILTISDFSSQLTADQPPLKLRGELQMPQVPDTLPVSGHLTSTFNLPPLARTVEAELTWQQNQGKLVVTPQGEQEALLNLPWEVTPQRITISGGHWRGAYNGQPLKGNVTLSLDNWQAPLQQREISGRLNILTQGHAGKGNAVLRIGPGRLDTEHSAIPLQFTGEVKQQNLIFYASLPMALRGSLSAPHLTFLPGALLRSRGQLKNLLSIDEIRLPLAGVTVTRQGVAGRLQAIAHAHRRQWGGFTLHLDGQAHQFMPDKGHWQWRYWGAGRFTPMQARWDVQGHGEWRNNTIVLNSLSTGFDKLQYGAMQVTTPRLILDKPLHWLRDPHHPALSGTLSLTTGATHFHSGSELPPATLKLHIAGHHPADFQFKGNLAAQQIGPVRLTGRWDGERLRGEAWWPQQPLTVFQPLIPPAWKMTLRDGTLYAQVAFSAATTHGFSAGGHGVLKAGSAWLPDNQINGVDFVLPFRYRDNTWHLGVHRPVSLRIGEIINQVTARNLTASLQGAWPWREQSPLQLSDVSVDILGGKITMQQLRMPQHTPALLRLHHLSSSELVSALNTKQFAMSGAFNGALPLWLDNKQWIIKDGWLNNPGPMTLRLDKEMADALVHDNLTGGAAINWLRYMEISRSWAHIDMDNRGRLTLQATVSGLSRVGKQSNIVHLNYSHQENMFDLWRNLRFADNVQTWFAEDARLPAPHGVISNKGKESQ